jgi:4-hydroxy-2-oxoglutarate aldolase
MTALLEGVFAALTTPFVDDEVSIPKFEENVRKLNGTGLAGYLVLGSTGECVSLSDAESEALVRSARAIAAPGKAVIAGTARESTRLTIDFTSRMADAGIDAALVRSPSYYKSRMSNDALKAHFLSVADKARVPVLLYNIPANTGISLEASLVIELSSHHNIIGLKESSGNIAYLGEVIRRVPPGFRYLLGSGSVFLPGLELGACGAILAVANAAPELCSKIYGLFRERKLDEALRLQLDLIPLNKAIMEGTGIAGLKHALDLRGYYGGPVRLPLLPPGEPGKAEIAALMRGLKLV